MVYKFDQIAYNITTKRTPTKDDMLTYIGLEHLESGCLNVSSYGSKVEIKGDKLVMTKGDVLLGKRNAYLRRAAIAPHDGLFSAHGMILRPKEEVIDKAFFPFFIASDIFFDEAVRISVGGLSPTINWKDLKEVEFTLPSLSEQKVLADKLWAAYRVKESYKKLLAATDDMLKAKFQEMFGEGKWEQKTLGEVGNFQRGGGFQKNDYVEQGIPCIHYGQIHTKFGPYVNAHLTEIKFELAKKTKYAVKGDLIVAITSEDEEGSCKSTAWLGNYPVAVGGHAAIFHHSMDPLFMTFYFKSSAFNYEKVKYTRGSKVVEIKPDDVAKIHVPVPPIELQQKFAEIATQAEATKESLRKSIENIDQVIKSLINQ